MGFKDAHIWFDGVANPDGSTLCVDEKGVDIADLDFSNDNPTMKMVTDYACDTKPSLTIN